MSDIKTRPKDSNADAWHLFLSEYLDARANSPSGMTFIAVQIAEAIDDAERRGASSNLPCGHHVSCLVKSVESDSRFCGFCDAMSQRNDAETMEERYRGERDSLRAKLERAKEALERLIAGVDRMRASVGGDGVVEDHDHCAMVPQYFLNTLQFIMRDMVSELSADAPAQSTMRPDAPAQQVEGCRGPWEGIKDRYAPAPAQPTQISDELREAMAEAEKALEPFASFAKSLLEWRDRFGLLQNEWPYEKPVLDRTHPTEGKDDTMTRIRIFRMDFTRAQNALAKLRSVKK